jgi:hypothetical protein
MVSIPMRCTVDEDGIHTQAPAQSGVASVSLSLHAFLDAWMMALQRTVVV